MFQDINNVADECLLYMAADGVPFQGPLILDNQRHLYSVLVDGKNKEASYFATFDGDDVFICSYGFVDDQKQYHYSSFQDLAQF